MKHGCSDGDDFQTYDRSIFLIFMELGQEYDIDEFILKLAWTFLNYCRVGTQISFSGQSEEWKRDEDVPLQPEVSCRGSLKHFRRNDIGFNYKLFF